MFITRRTLPRRTFLRAMGTAVALPMLDAMVPALASAASTAPVPRLGFIYIANGVIQKEWTPATTGAGFELTPAAESLLHRVHELTTAEQSQPRPRAASPATATS